MLPNDECDDGCVLPLIQHKLRSYSSSAIVFSTTPFLLTFLIVAITASTRLFPRLSIDNATSRERMRPHSRQSRTSSFQPVQLKQAHSLLRGLSNAVFSTTVALSAVLAEVILCEISNSLDPSIRKVILELTVTLLLALLIVVTPLFEVYSVVQSTGLKFSGSQRSKYWIAWIISMAIFSIWIVGFWWVGQVLPAIHTSASSSKTYRQSLREACLERIGVVGIFFMALLSGFASVSSPLQNFFTVNRPVSETDIVRKQAALEATEDMLIAKRNRVQFLDRKMMELPQDGFMTRMMGSFRGNSEAAERASLHLEISGLETMRSSLFTTLAILQNRYRDQQHALTAKGRVVLSMSYAFSLYCMYRIVATLFATIRRWWSPSSTFSNSDPINNILAILAKHWDPSLDRISWSRQISFLLSGVILLASFSSVLQTIHFFSRFAPSIVQHAQANLTLVVGQICATYVISSALLLRSSVPKEVGSVISDALGAPLELSFVDWWFEGWFLFASGLTASAVFVVRKLGVLGEWDDYFDDGDVELEKRV